MPVNIRSFFIQLICGGAGGYISGAGFRVFSWGAAGDVVIGVAGGALGGRILEHFLAGDAYASDMEIFLASMTGGCLGGALMVIILGTVKIILRRR
jgi:hypothetical protein